MHILSLRSEATASAPAGADALTPSEVPANREKYREFRHLQDDSYAPLSSDQAQSVGVTGNNGLKRQPNYQGRNRERIPCSDIPVVDLR